MKTVLLIFGSGGHTEQMLRFVKNLPKNHNYECVFVKNDKLSKDKFFILNKKLKLNVTSYYYINRIREMTSNRLYNLLYLLYSPIITFFQSLKLIFKSKSKIMISFGPGLTIPIFYFGKLFRKKTIYLETWSRVWTPSLTGKLVYPVSDLFFVQWPELKKKYPNAIYVGRLG